MYKKIFVLLITIAFIFTSTGISFAAKKGNKRKGKYLYRNVYKDCNKRGGINSSKPVLSPDSKTMAQWKRTFDKKKFAGFGCKEEWDKLSEKELLDIFTYLHSHAADSPTPAKCK